MELPARLRRAVDDLLEGEALSELTAAATILSERYRDERLDGRLHVASDLMARAYLATRLPATYAAIRDAMTRVAQLRPAFEPKTLLDIGAGPGTALWAACDCWPGLDGALLLEASGPMRRYGESLAQHAGLTSVEWRETNIAAAVAGIGRRDLVCLGYVLSELPTTRHAGLIDDIWSLTADMMLVVEPGTPKGWERILAARRRLIEHGAHIVAPCPHHDNCPIVAPDWCHFSRRVARSRLHRLAKNADVPWEDEKYIYLAASRRADIAAAARILEPPRTGKGRVELKLCCSDGKLRLNTVSRRHGALFKSVRRLDWGDVIEDHDDGNV